MDGGKTALVISRLRHAFVCALSDHETHKFNSSIPFFFEFEKTRAQLCLKHLVTTKNCKSIFIRGKTDGKVTGHDSNQSTQSSVQENGEREQTGNSEFEAPGLSERSEDEILSTDCANNQIFLSLLKSPVYDVRLGVLDVLLSSINSSSETGDQSDWLNTVQACHGSDEADLELSSQAQVCKVFLPEAKAVVRALYHYLVKMAMETETHHLCQEKVIC